jgi:hypothetical protein
MSITWLNRAMAEIRICQSGDVNLPEGIVSGFGHSDGTTRAARKKDFHRLASSMVKLVSLIKGDSRYGCQKAKIFVWLVGTRLHRIIPRGILKENLIELLSRMENPEERDDLADMYANLLELEDEIEKQQESELLDRYLHMERASARRRRALFKKD